MRLREEAADEVDRLLAFLDATEGDVDLEGDDADGEEPEHTEDNNDLELVCEDEGAEHDGSEPDAEGEPSLGWTIDGYIGNTSGTGCDCELDGSYATPAAYDRYKIADRWVTKRDGRHIGSGRGFGLNRRLRNLSDEQSKLVKPRIHRASGVAVSS